MYAFSMNKKLFSKSNILKSLCYIISGTVHNPGIVFLWPNYLEKVYEWESLSNPTAFHYAHESSFLHMRELTNGGNWMHTREGEGKQ